MSKKFLLLSYLVMIIFLLVSIFFVTNNQNKLGKFPIILITVDGVRQDKLGIYGYEKNITPNIDILFRESVVYNNAISQKPMTIPAMYSIFTGQYPVDVNFDSLDTSKYLPCILQPYYNTLGIVSTNLLANGTGFNTCFDLFYDTNNLPTYTDIATVNASTIISKVKAVLELNNGNNFFLWIHFKDTHTTYTPSARFSAQLEKTRNYTYLPVNEEFWDGYMGIPKQAYIENRTEIEYYIDMYESEIKTIDYEIGNLMQILNKTKLLGSSILILTSLHGESLGEHNFYFVHSSTVDEADIRVPLIVKFPDKKLRIIDNQVGISQIFNIIVNQTVDVNHPETLFLEDVPIESTKHPEFHMKEYGIRSQDYKIIENSDGSDIRFYNLGVDMRESQNLLSLEMDMASRIIFEKLYGELLNYKEIYGYDLTPSFDNVRIRTYEAEDSDKASLIISGDLALVKSSYATSFSPYIGVITREITCGEKFLPREYNFSLNNMAYPYLIMYTNQRLNLGVCNEDSVTFKMLIGWFYNDEERKVYRLTYFIPQDAETELLTMNFFSFIRNNYRSI